MHYPSQLKHKKNTHRLWTSAQKVDKNSVFVVQCNVNGLVYLNRILDNNELMNIWTFSLKILQ